MILALAAFASIVLGEPQRIIRPPTPPRPRPNPSPPRPRPIPPPRSGGSRPIIGEVCLFCGRRGRRGRQVDPTAADIAKDIAAPVPVAARPIARTPPAAAPIALPSVAPVIPVRTTLG